MRLIAICAVALATVALSANAAPPADKGGGKPTKIQTAPLAQTGQTTVYQIGDDGDLQKGVPSPSPRFVVNGDGTATDRLTKLTWTTDTLVGERRVWWQAVDGCHNYPSGNPEGWRLPNFKELLSLVDFENSFPSLPEGHPFTNVVMPGADSGWYWSSTTSPVSDYPHEAYVVALNRAEVGTQTKMLGLYWLCVRDAL